MNLSFDEKTDPSSSLEHAKNREFVNQLDNLASSTPYVSLEICTACLCPHSLMQSQKLSIIDVRDSISDTKAELKKKADDWTAFVNFYESAGWHRMDREQVQHREPSDGQPHGEGSND